MALTLAASSACTRPASYVIDQSNSAQTVKALLIAADTNDRTTLSGLVEPNANLVYQADVSTNITVESLNRYVMPRLEACGQRKIKQTFASPDQSVVLVGCLEPVERAPLEGGDISFFVRKGKILGANTNDGMAVMGESVDG